MACETANTFDPTIQSRVIDSTGHQEESYGLAQIHLPAHPEVTMAEALDPVFSIDFMAKNMAKGKYSMWSCYTELYYSK